MKVEKYIHEGVEVTVISEFKNKLRDHWLCGGCKFYKPGETGNCRIYESVSNVCKTFDIVTPIYQCPVFEPRPESGCKLHPSSDRKQGRCTSCYLKYPPEDISAQ